MLASDVRVRLYRTMYLSRRLDEVQVRLKQQQKTYFQASGAGHEAVLVAAGCALSSRDWYYPYYRDQALCLMLGVTPYELVLDAVGAAASSSSGRQMPGFFSSRRCRIVSQSGPTGMQFLQAVGCAEASVYRQSSAGPIDEIVYVSSGEGATSEGEFWEAINTAATNKLPVLFLIQDNGYAISVPSEAQTPGGSISRVVSSIPNLFVKTCDGTDPLASYDVLSAAAAHCRRRHGPALVHASVIRAHAHSISDDERSYRTDEERSRDAARDPIPRFRRHLLDSRALDETTLKSLEDAVDQEIAGAVDRALAAPPPEPSTIFDFVYAPGHPAVPSVNAAPLDAVAGETMTMVEAINACLRDEMAGDDRVVVFGQDVADLTREELLPSLKGKGGVFKATAGLQRRFGSRRVFNTPIAEANIVGRAIGMATCGLKPVVEIQFFDYIWTAMMQIRNELAVLRWRSADAFACPVVIRAPIGGYLTGSAIYHSQSGEVTFTHIPGLRVVMPSTADDAAGLLRTAIRCDDPVLFLEPKHLYRQPHNRGPYRGPDYVVPFGRAALRRTGADLTIVTYGSTVHRSLQAAAALQRDGISVEVLDLRSLQPYDWDAIAASVRKTNRALVVHEDWKSWGYGAELAARMGDELFAWLDAPVRRVAAADVFCGYHPALEGATLPQTDDIAAAAHALMEF